MKFHIFSRWCSTRYRAFSLRISSVFISLPHRPIYGFNLNHFTSSRMRWVLFHSLHIERPPNNKRYSVESRMNDIFATIKNDKWDNINFLRRIYSLALHWSCSLSPSVCLRQSGCLCSTNERMPNACILCVCVCVCVWCSFNWIKTKWFAHINSNDKITCRLQLTNWKTVCVYIWKDRLPSIAVVVGKWNKNETEK